MFIALSTSIIKYDNYKNQKEYVKEIAYDAVCFEVSCYYYFSPILLCSDDMSCWFVTYILRYNSICKDKQKWLL